MAIYLNGTTQYLSGGPTFTSLPTNWSIGGWVYLSAFAATQIAAGVTNSGGWGVSIPDSGRVRLTFYTVNDYDSDALSLSANVWVHILIVKAGSTLSYYVNGTARGSDTIGSYVSGGAQGIYLGARNSGGSPANYLGGRMAEWAIWDSDVSASVGTLYASAATGAAPNTVGSPVHYWPLDTDATATLGGFNLTAQNSPSFTTHASAGLTISSADTTAPVLTSPTGTATGSTTATVGATTDEANGTLYAFVSTSATPPSDADLKAGTGAVWAGSQAVSSTGAKTLNATGLTASTGYYAHLLHTDAATNDSNTVTSAQFTTNAPGVTPPVHRRAFNLAILNH